MIDSLEIMAATLGIMGAILVAQGRHQLIGYFFFTVSSAAFISWSILLGHYGVMSMNALFFIINVYGLVSRRPEFNSKEGDKGC